MHSSPTEVDSFFHHMLGLHDIGKSLAVRGGEKGRQHEYIMPLLNRYFQKAGFNEAERKLADAIVGHDSIGLFLTRRISLPDAIAKIREQAAKAGMGERDFFKLQMLYYTSDAACYPGVADSVFGAHDHTYLLKHPVKVGNPAFVALAKEFGIPELAGAYAPPAYGAPPT